MMEEILTRIRTVEERDQLLSELELIQASLYQPRALNRVLKSGVRAWVTQALEKANLTRPENIEKFISEIKQLLIKLTPVKLTLAFEPQDQALDRIFAASEETFGKKIVLDIEIDPKIIGGTLISWKGKFIDLSVKKKLDEYWQKKYGQL